MIEAIHLKAEASFDQDGQSLTGLKELNYIYGANGSGKTTISRVIADESQFDQCALNWKAGNKLETFTYNRDFVASNFSQESELKGIFTLGEKEEATLIRIAEAKDELDKIGTDIDGKKNTLQGPDGEGGKKAELKGLADDFKGVCWGLKERYDQFFKKALSGVRNNKEKFKAKFEQEAVKEGIDLLSLEELKEKAATVFADDLVKETLIPPLLYDDLIELGDSPILAKLVIGKSDVDIAAMITSLGNTDWVKEGRSYFEANDGHCPFCQQTTDDEFAKSLEEYFDEAYLTDIAAIDTLTTNYDIYSQAILTRLQSIVDAAPKYLDCTSLTSHKEIFETKIRANKQHIVRKRKEASIAIELESLQETLDTISNLISSANAKISAHNATVDNIANERADLTSRIWRFLAEEIQPSWTSYKGSKEGLEAAINGLKAGIQGKEAERTIKRGELRDLEKSVTSIQPTIDGINGLLLSFGFSSFSLKASEKEGYYKIIRPDGGDAKDTLSEGERTFITFLYFYYLLKGSNTESGITTDRIVVFDDPVSSLDSDILFIVSNLIKGLFDEIRGKEGHIKQIYILTHNIYFHREITFHKKRSNGAMKDETFWVVKKSGNCSKLEKHDNNPIKTSYELLWSEVRDENRSTLTIQNTLRRILENYFKILGNIDNAEIINVFEGKDKLICSSLFSWTNAGSHFANDDLYLACGPEAVEKYLEIFKNIFEKSGHMGHYNMMMATGDEENAGEADLEAGQPVLEVIS